MSRRHTFLTGGNTLAMDEEIMSNIQDSLHHVGEVVDKVLRHTLAINDRTLALADLPTQLQAGFKEMRGRLKGLGRVLVEVAAAATCPTMFVITPDFTPKQAVMTMQPGGEAATEVLQACSSWTEDLGEVFQGKLGLSQLVRKVAFRRYRLFLCCEKCMEPQGNGYLIEKTGEWLVKMLPGLKMTLVVAKAYNVIASLGRLFFPALPVIPADV